MSCKVKKSDYIASTSDALDKKERREIGVGVGFVSLSLAACAPAAAAAALLFCVISEFFKCVINSSLGNHFHIKILSAAFHSCIDMKEDLSTLLYKREE